MLVSEMNGSHFLKQNYISSRTTFPSSPAVLWAGKTRFLQHVLLINADALLCLRGSISPLLSSILKEPGEGSLYSFHTELLSGKRE